jgi:hypothetical protein
LAKGGNNGGDALRGGVFLPLCGEKPPRRSRGRGRRLDAAPGSAQRRAPLGGGGREWRSPRGRSLRRPRAMTSFWISLVPS